MTHEEWVRELQAMMASLALVCIVIGWFLNDAWQWAVSKFVKYKRYSAIIENYEVAINDIDDAQDLARRDMNDAAGQSWRNIGSW